MVMLPTLTVSGYFRPLTEPVIGFCVVITLILSSDVVRDPPPGKEYNFVEAIGAQMFYDACVQWYDVMTN